MSARNCYCNIRQQEIVHLIAVVLHAIVANCSDCALVIADADLINYVAHTARYIIDS